MLKMKKLLFLGLLVPLSSCGGNETKTFYAGLKVLGENASAALWIDGFDQTKLLRSLDSSKAIYPGDEVKVTFDKNGDIVAYQVKHASEEKVRVRRIPNDQRFEYDFVYANNEEKVLLNRFFLTDRVLNASMDFVPIEEKGPSTFFESEIAGKVLDSKGEVKKDSSYFHEFSYADPLPSKAVFLPKLTLGKDVFTLRGDGKGEEKRALKGLAVHQDYVSVYESLYPGLTIYGCPQTPLIEEGAEDIACIYEGREAGTYVLESLRGDSAIYRK